MVDLVVLQSISYMAGALGVCIAAFYYVMTLRAQQKIMKSTLETRQADFLLRQTQAIMGTQYQEAWSDFVWNQRFSTGEEWAEKYGPNANLQAYNNTMMITMYYNHLGVLLKENMIPEKVLVETITPVVILMTWKRLEPLVKRWRSMYQDESLLDGFEYLIAKIRERHPKIYENLNLPAE